MMLQAMAACTVLEAQLGKGVLLTTGVALPSGIHWPARGRVHGKGLAMARGHRHMPHVNSGNGITHIGFAIIWVYNVFAI